MSYLAIASGCDLVSFVWARTTDPVPQPRAIQNTFELSSDWKPVRLVIELGHPALPENADQDPERWDGLA